MLSLAKFFLHFRGSFIKRPTTYQCRKVFFLFDLFAIKIETTCVLVFKKYISGDKA